MKCLFVGCSVITALSTTRAEAFEGGSGSQLTLPRVSYAELTNIADEQFVEHKIIEALQSIGMVSITHIPDFDKHGALSLLPKCLQQLEDGKVLQEWYPDGTLRETLGVRWDAGEEEEDIRTTTNDNSDKESRPQACVELEERRVPLQHAVTAIGLAIGRILEKALQLQSVPLLRDFEDEEQGGFTLTDILAQGDMLEHYHAYHTLATAPQEDPVKAIDWHVDQGLFLLFVPGTIQQETTEGFYVRLPDGSEPMVQFEQDKDDLVLLLGDGINQYVNQALIAQNVAPLQVIPHALVMPSTGGNTDEPRLWYGRMFLPPPQAQHPIVKDLSYGELSNAMAAEHVSGMEHGPALAIGCSSNTMRALNAGHGGNTPNASSCDNVTNKWCWHRCQNITADATEAVCQAEGKELKCMTQLADGQRLLWDHSHNPIFKLGCVAATADVYNATVHGQGSGAVAGPTTGSIWMSLVAVAATVWSFSAV